MLTTVCTRSLQHTPKKGTSSIQKSKKIANRKRRRENHWPTCLPILPWVWSFRKPQLLASITGRLVGGGQGGGHFLSIMKGWPKVTHQMTMYPSWGSNLKPLELLAEGTSGPAWKVDQIHSPNDHVACWGSNLKPLELLEVVHQMIRNLTWGSNLKPLELLIQLARVMVTPQYWSCGSNPNLWFAVMGFNRSSTLSHAKWWHVRRFKLCTCNNCPGWNIHAASQEKACRILNAKVEAKNSLKLRRPLKIFLEMMKVSLYIYIDVSQKCGTF